MEKSKINKSKKPSEKNINEPLQQDGDEVTTPLNNSTANPAKQKNIQEADQQPQVTTSTRNHIRKENEFADSGKANGKARQKNKSVKEEDPEAKQKENKNIAKGYL